MSFRQLYEAVQACPRTNGARISTKWLRTKAIEYSDITKVVEQWSGVIDDTSLRGFYLEGPIGPPIPLQEREAMITLARKVGSSKPWRRLIYTKELMHVFDTEEEKTNNAEKLGKLVNKFGDPDAESTAQFRAEVKAMWRAFAVLCREDDRKTLNESLRIGNVSLEVVSASLRLPARYLQPMFDDRFLDRVAKVLDG